MLAMRPQLDFGHSLACNTYQAMPALFISVWFITSTLKHLQALPGKIASEGMAKIELRTHC